MKKRAGVMLIIVHMLMVMPCIGIPDGTSSQRIEDFAGFPHESPEPWHYVREYPYVSLSVIAAVVGGIIYYNRTQIKKKVRQLLYLVRGQEIEESAEIKKPSA